MIWNGPAFGMDEVDYLTIAGDVLSTGKSSRLYKRLVYQDQIATDVAAFAFPRELGGLFGIIATAQPGGDLAALEAAINEELERFIAEGPSREELARSKTGQRAGLFARRGTGRRLWRQVRCAGCQHGLRRQPGCA